MDGIEIARKIAADLHRQAVEKGRDPWQPYEFTVAEANSRDIDVEPTASGAAMLNGGRATFVAKDRLILHENGGTRFDQAFLVAHEIGHVELGDDPDGEPESTIDPTRSAEPSPIGVDRVVDYGRRQRREVQIDLFAREFLLPRPVVRKLHIEEGLTASAIAQRLGAPFEVVAQQLLDALLLPPIAPKAEKQTVERPLNPLQAEAAKHRGKAYLLEAGPGTGKTQTLTARVAGLIDDKVDPRRILLLTFSNKAAGEMAERIAQKNKQAAAAMWIGTFHAFGLDLIRRFHTELGLPKDPRMMDRTEAAELLEHEFPRLGLIHYRNIYDPTQIILDMLAAISRAKDEVVDDKQYAELAETMLRNAITADDQEAAKRAGEVARVYTTYETLKRQAHCVDFGDLVSMPVCLMEGDAAIRNHLKNQYDHVLVDEYQDVNRSSVRVLAALRDNGDNLWAVGDAKQSIYRFRGASSFNMKRFGKQDFAGGARGRLKQNYRSVDEVVEAFSAFAVDMKTGDTNSDLRSTRAPPANNRNFAQSSGPTSRPSRSRKRSSKCAAPATIIVIRRCSAPAMKSFRRWVRSWSDSASRCCSSVAYLTGQRSKTSSPSYRYSPIAAPWALYGSPAGPSSRCQSPTSQQYSTTFAGKLASRAHGGMTCRRFLEFQSKVKRLWPRLQRLCRDSTKAPRLGACSQQRCSIGRASPPKSAAPPTSPPGRAASQSGS